MSLIEGFGDEVTIFLAIILILLIVCLAWISTNIRDIPFFSVIIIELTHRRNRDTENTNQVEVQSSSEVTPNSDSQASSETDAVGTETVSSENIPAGQSEVLAENNQNVQSTSETVQEEGKNENSESSQRQLPQESQTESIELPKHLNEKELRQRRLHFFQGNKDKANISNPQSAVDPQNPNNLSSLQEFSSQSSVTDFNARQQETTADENQPNSSERDTVQSTETDSETGIITVRLKYLNDTQRNVTAAPNVTIGQFRRDNFATELSENKLVRFIFNGQDLRNDSNTLQNYNIGNNSVVHCLITQVNQQTPQQRSENQGSCDFGVVVLPIFGLILCFVWYLRFEYRQFFTATSTFMLIGLTFLFIAAVLASWDSQRHREQVPHEHMD
ncbi:transmembrane and ubiquitin-like domain-containing protein 1 [Saccostrea echinata]|uniref:transmembrane and ubiquitin-like domain-containing protein 1 n=1 Tax=Saccostrea echinata TaxID=191078 RepID=UPI002A812DBD|nr:transmembrane and ubiquitin-like domain-containing protein 1 [Saccostrea echinata]